MSLYDSKINAEENVIWSNTYNGLKSSDDIVSSLTLDKPMFK